MDLSGKQARNRVPSRDEPQSSLRTGGLQAAAAMVGPVCFRDQLAGCHLQEALQATQEGQVPAPWAPQGCDPPLVQPFRRSSLTEPPHSQLPVSREGLILPRVRMPWGHADRNYSLWPPLEASARAAQGTFRMTILPTHYTRPDPALCPGPHPEKGQAPPRTLRPFKDQASSLEAFCCPLPLSEQRKQGAQLWPQSTGAQSRPRPQGQRP